MHDELEKLDKAALIEIITEKTDYLSMIVHQLRTPLTAEKWFLEMLATGHMGVIIPTEHQDMVTKAQENIENTLKLLRELSAANHTCNWKMTFAPIRSDLSDIIEHSVNMFAGEAMAKHISIITHTDHDTPHESMVDPDKISIVFQNILENALKYSHTGTTISIRVDSLHDDTLVSITDQGIGIPYDDQKYICTKLYRGGNTAGISGTGLGMYIAKQICDYHHGSLWFESIPDIGTTFFVKLPKV